MKSWSLHPRDPIESQWPPKVPISEYHHVGGKNFNLWMSKDTNIQFSLYVLVLAPGFSWFSPQLQGELITVFLAEKASFLLSLCPACISSYTEPISGRKQNRRMINYLDFSPQKSVHLDKRPPPAHSHHPPNSFLGLQHFSRGLL